MACNVFGTPITDETLKGMTKYHDKNITRLDKAEVAFEMKNAEGKDVNAHKYLENIKSGHTQEGIKVSMYNATGGTVKLVCYRHGDGCVGQSPIPVVIANGQWGAYFHAVDPKETGHNTANHAIVFAGKNADGNEKQWMYAMEAEYPGKCFTEIRPAGYYPLRDNSCGNYEEKLSSNRYYYQASDLGCESFASIGCDTKSPFFQGIMTLDAAFGW